MAGKTLRRRKRRTSDSDVDGFVEEQKEPGFDKIISTGSTLLDLSISGKRIRGGGVPPGIIVEIFGPSGAGKTALLSEIAASIQVNSGQVKFLDPEARLDKQYSKIYGLDLKEEDYERPDTVSQMFDIIWNWEPENNNVINCIAADSLAALSTEMELEDGDKFGMRRAKEFSEGLRKTCRIIANNDWIIACSNQEREGKSGTVTPGGKGIPFYASLRIRIKPSDPSSKLTRNRKIGAKNVEKVIGIQSLAQVIKSSVDEPFRQCPIYITFGHGIDDIRGNLQWYKDMTGDTTYYGRYKIIEKAILNVEECELEEELREKVIDLWMEIEKRFSVKRKRKRRF